MSKPEGIWVVQSMAAASAIVVLLVMITAAVSWPDFSSTQSSCTQEGMNAYTRGLGIAANPYRIGSKVRGKHLGDDRERSKQWIEGWLAKQKQDRQ